MASDTVSSSIGTKVCKAVSRLETLSSLPLSADAAMLDARLAGLRAKWGFSSVIPTNSAAAVERCRTKLALLEGGAR